MNEIKNAEIAKRILYTNQNESSGQVRNQALGMIYQQRKTINNRESYFPASSYDATPENNLLARVVDYCLKNDEIANFKDIDAIAAIVKKNINNITLSVYSNVVISNGLSDFLVQYSKNDDKNPAIINTTRIHLAKDGNVSGNSTDYTLVKKSITEADEKQYFFEEEVLSRCDIYNMDEANKKNMTSDEKKLYRQMEICSSLISPVMKKLGVIIVSKEDENKQSNDKKENNSSAELNNMLNNQDTKIGTNNTNKSI